MKKSLHGLRHAGVIIIALAVSTSATCKTTSENQNYCSVRNGDAYCAAHHPWDGRRYCIWGNQECRERLALAYLNEGESFDGCISEVPAEGDACHSPCGGGIEFQDELECPGEELSCSADEECTDELPFCMDGVCVECTPADDDLCASVGHICDPARYECVPCDAHEDCEIGACHIFEGTCFPPGTQRSVLTPGMDVANVIARVSPGEYRIITLAGVGADSPYESVAVIGDDKIIAILDDAYGYPRPRVHAPAMSSFAILVTGGATLYMQGVEVSGHDRMGTTPLSCEDGARLHMRGAVIAGNASGTTIRDCEARLENCFLQSLYDDAPALRVDGDSNVELVYATLVSDAGSEGGHNAVLSCFGASDLVMRNSFLLTLRGYSGPEIEDSCDSMMLEHSILESAPVFGVGNDVLEPPLDRTGLDYSTWFCDYNSGDLHLDIPNIDTTFAPHMTDSSHLEIAVPAPGDDTRDIDGDDRTTSAMVGADVPGSCPS